MIVLNESHALLKHLLSGALECCDPQLASEIAWKGGYRAGENFVYNHLDLSDPPAIFCQKLRAKSQFSGFPAWNFCQTNRQYQIQFACIPGCPGRQSCQNQRPPLYCKFMQGYLLGALESYQGAPGQLVVHCHTQPEPCCFHIFPASFSHLPLADLEKKTAGSPPSNGQL